MEKYLATIKVHYKIYYGQFITKGCVSVFLEQF